VAWEDTLLESLSQLARVVSGDASMSRKHARLPADSAKSRLLVPGAPAPALLNMETSTRSLADTAEDERVMLTLRLDVTTSGNISH
jgi:hypothetical protein